MKVLKSIGIAVAVVSGGVFSQGVLAACVITGNTEFVIPVQPAIEIDPSLPDELLAEFTVDSTGGGGSYECERNTSWAMTTDLPHIPTSVQVFETGIPGVGLGMTVNLVSFSREEFWTIPRTGSSSRFTVTPIGMPTVRFRLVKTREPIVSGGYISPTPQMARLSAGDSAIYNISLAAPIEVVVRGATCTATAQSTIILDDVSSIDFDPSGRAKSTDFNIDLSCTGTGTTDVSATLTDANSPGNTGATLTPASGSDAEGVVLEVHKGSGSNSPVQFGSKWLAIQGAQQGSYQIPLSVNYLKNGPLKSGEVKAGMTYTLDYE